MNFQGVECRAEKNAKRIVHLSFTYLKHFPEIVLWCGGPIGSSMMGLIYGVFFFCFFFYTVPSNVGNSKA